MFVNFPDKKEANELFNEKTHLNLKIYNTEINGTFIDGHLKEGEVKKDNIIYRGTFDDELLLHGPNCTIEYNGFKYNGEFINGVMKSGITLDHANVLIEKGEYSNTRDKIPRLQKGVKLLVFEQQFLEGEFKGAKLYKGNIITNNKIISGYFDELNITEKTCYYLLQKKNTIVNYPDIKIDDLERIKSTFIHTPDTHELFICNYKIEKRNFIANDTFAELYSYCHVNYKGPIELLPKDLFIMLCCNGTGTETLLANKFYIQYLFNFDPLFIKQRLSLELFENITPLEKEAVKIIMNNLRNYNINTICSNCILNRFKALEGIVCCDIRPVYFKCSN
jgi:hypothetical protein